MMRYLMLYLHFLRFSFSKALEFRLDFTFKIVMDCIYYAVNISFFKLIYLHTPILGGWNQDQMMVFVASFLLVDAIHMTIFSTNLWMLPYMINRGELDYYLIRPVSPLFFLSFREFSANSFLNMLIAAGFFAYTLVQYPHPFSFGELVLLLILLINGVLIHYCLQMMMLIPVFWTQSSRGFMDLFFSMGLAMERPDQIYRGWLRRVFTILLPFALIASFPARIFIDKFNWPTINHIIVVTTLLWIVMLTFWRLGLRNYSSASS